MALMHFPLLYGFNCITHLFLVSDVFSHVSINCNVSSLHFLGVVMQLFGKIMHSLCCPWNFKVLPCVSMGRYEVCDLFRGLQRIFYFQWNLKYHQVSLRLFKNVPYLPSILMHFYLFPWTLKHPLCHAVFNAVSCVPTAFPALHMS